MGLNIDGIIFIGFLAVTVFIGLRSSRGIKNIREFAIGNRNFSTATIAATVIATWISGSFFFNRLSETYSNGLYFMWAAIGTSIELIIVGLIFAPRMHEFLGKISVAEAMSSMYGEKVRVITAVCGFIGTVGYIAVQLKVAGSLFEYCFNIHNFYGIIIGAVIVTVYSALGGIKSVTFTDVIQLITFGTIIPTTAFFILSNLGSLDLVLDTLRNHEAFNYKEVFDFTRPKSLYYLFLFLYMSTPIFNPPIFQRISMSKNILQAQKSFVIAGIGCFILTIIVFWTSILVLSTTNNLDPNDIVKYIIFNYSHDGLKGLILAGIMAMVMSTADSYINSTAVIFIHDFCKPLKLRFVKNELHASRIASFVLGIFGLLLALRGESILKIVITTYSFYMPIVTIPFIAGVLGFRSSTKSVIIGMSAGFVVALIWTIFDINVIDAIVPGMVANLSFLVGSHYILNQPGGWVKNQHSQIGIGRKKNKNQIITAIRNFNFTEFFRSNTPRSEGIFVATGFFCMIMIYFTMHTIPQEVVQKYHKLIKIINPLSLFFATTLISYPLWLERWKDRSTLALLVWHAVIFSMLICTSCLFVLITNFTPESLMVFMINLIIVVALVRWQLALAMIILGSIFTIQMLKLYTNSLIVIDPVKGIYLLLLLSSTLIIFLKPKQDYQELTEEKNRNLSGKIGFQEKQLREALALKSEFIRNISHEYHAPMTGITSMAEVLAYSYDKLTDKQRKAAIDTIVESSRRLDVFDSNISALSALSKAGYELNLKTVDLSDLLYNRIDVCRRLYEENKEDREFIVNIEDGIVLDLDENYLTQTIDNLIINAITYCTKGKITITLKRDPNQVICTIEDEGIGIPRKELHDVFDEFTVSSKTHTPAGGRGVGLALCKRVIEVHDGRIWAESNGNKGAKFFFTVPYGKKGN